jgi:hypothetical protein
MDVIGREVSGSANRESRDRDNRERCLRMAYLCAEADRKVDEAARELSAFDAALVAFAVSPFRIEALAGVVERLERYVEDYIAEATERARKLHRTAKKLLGRGYAQILRATRDTVNRHLREDPFAAPSAASWPIHWRCASGSSPFSHRVGSTTCCSSGFMRRQGTSSDVSMPTSLASGRGISG